MNYELLLWLKPDLSNDEIKKEALDLEKFSASGGAAEIKIENLGRAKLAYLIKHFREGIKLLVNLESGPQKIKELLVSLKTNENVLRYLITRLPMQNSKVKMQN